MSERQRICLCMIVKNEAHVIRRCLESVKPWITHWAIVDTGSTDGTQDEIRRCLGELPGVLLEKPWVGFATNRNQSLTAAERFAPDYLFVIDADEELVGNTGEPLPELTDDGYALELQLVGENVTWRRPCLVKAGRGWKYESSVGREGNELHEYLIAPGRPASTLIQGVTVKSYNDSARNTAGAQKKAARDAKLLRRGLKTSRDAARTWFYLARSLATAGDIDGAIVAYERRAEFPDTLTEENWFALYQAAGLRAARGDDWRDVARTYLRAYDRRPQRAEPLWCLAQLHSDHKEFATAEMFARVACSKPVPPDVQPLDRSVYDWRVPLELAVAIANQGRLSEALAIVKRIESSPSLPHSELPNVRRLASELQSAA